MDWMLHVVSPGAPYKMDVRSTTPLQNATRGLYEDPTMFSLSTIFLGQMEKPFMCLALAAVVATISTESPTFIMKAASRLDCV